MLLETYPCPGVLLCLWKDFKVNRIEGLMFTMQKITHALLPTALLAASMHILQQIFALNMLRIKAQDILVYNYSRMTCICILCLLGEDLACLT